MFSTLKVALVASSLGRAGAEKQFCYMAKALFEAGIDARVYHLGNGGHYATVLQESKVPFYGVKHPGNRGSILIELTKEMVRFRPHAVIASQFGDVSYAGVAGRAAGSFVIAGIRSSGSRDIQLFGSRSRWMMRLAHGFMANSQCARKNLIALGLSPEKIAVLPNVIDLPAFESHSQTPHPMPGRIIALAVGRLHPNKRFEWFIEAVALARRKCPQICGIIVGGDEGDHNRLQQCAARLGLAPENLSFYGECSNVPSLFRHARMLVLTSREEGFPNSILEAMSAQLPVITTPAGDAPVLVEHGRTGYVAQSVQDIASHMVTLADSPELSETMGLAARQSVERQFQYPCLAPRLLSILQDFSSRRNSARLKRALHPGSLFKGVSVCELLTWASRS